MGLRVKMFRSAMFIVCSVVVASLVSITGIIGFVGLVVPHVVRLLSRTSDNRTRQPAGKVSHLREGLVSRASANDQTPRT